MEPILVIFEERKEKELVWTKLRDNLKTKTNVVVTQDSSTRRLEGRQMERQQSVPRKISTKSQSSPRKTAVVKPSTHSPDRRLTPEVPQTPQPPPPEQRTRREKKVSKPKVSVTRSPKKSLSRQESLALAEPEEEDVYSGLDASHSLIIHGKTEERLSGTDTNTPGIETDWIEEEMSDDDDFRKDVIEQKIKKVLEEIGFTKKIVYKVVVSGTIHLTFNTLYISVRISSAGLMDRLTTGFLQSWPSSRTRRTRRRSTRPVGRVSRSPAGS